MITNYLKFLEKFRNMNKGFGFVNESIMVNPDTNPEINRKAYDIIKKSLMMINSNFTFFYILLDNLNIKQARPEDKIPTMATDGRNLLYNPEFVVNLFRNTKVERKNDERVNDADVSQVLWVLCHEAMHCALLHFARGSDLDPYWYNRAGDYAINLLLEGVGRVPIDIKNDKGEVIFSGPLLDNQFLNMSTEQIYDKITAGKKPSKQKPKKPQKFKCPECGSDLTGKKIKMNKSKTAWICPDCGEEIPIEQPPKFECPSCNSDLTGKKIKKTKDGKKWICPDCGDEFDIKKSPPPQPECPVCHTDLKGKKLQKTPDGKRVICPVCGAELPIPEGPPSEGEGDEGEPGEPGEDGGKGKAGEIRDDAGEDITAEQVEAKIGDDDVYKPGDLDQKGIDIKQGWDGTSSTNPEDMSGEWIRIATTAAERTQGTGSENLRRWIKALTIPKVNWRAELRKFVANCYDSIKHLSFNRRTISTRGFPSPSSYQKDVQTFDNAVICVDTSGSIGDEELAVFAAEMNGIVAARGIKTLRVIWCDAQVCNVQLFGDKRESLKPKETYAGDVKNFHLRLEPCGGGGTSFVPPFAWMNENLKVKEIAFIIYFTDAQGDAPSPAMVSLYEKRIIWFVFPSTMDCSALGDQAEYVDRDSKTGEVIAKRSENAKSRRWRIIKLNTLK